MMTFLGILLWDLKIFEIIWCEQLKTMKMFDVVLIDEIILFLPSSSTLKNPVHNFLSSKIIKIT